MKNKIWLLIPVVILLLAIIFFMGNRPNVSNLNPKISDIKEIVPNELDKQITDKEATITGLKDKNESKIFWKNPETKEKTPYSIVYLHGFSASYGEGNPVHRKTAQYFGCNLYVPRLYKHGIDEKNALLDFNSEAYIESAKEAIKVGKQIGEKVIVMGTSAGGMLAIYLAAKNPDLIEALILYSPLVDFYDDDIHLLNLPWGLQIGQMVTGSDIVNITTKNEMQKQFWTTQYRLEAVVNLVSLNEAIMKPAIFNEIKCPVFLGYYYKDEENQDKVVSVPAMLEMFDELGTPENLKQKVAFEDAKEHVICSEIVSGNWQRVMDSTHYFLAFTLNLNPADELEEDVLELLED
ncbi:alpha/beta hydrolase [Chondrinema litorale]|uniref:alpha/beta hydrolase n=1 Tax=Chondrinema litorale TaxID=2994555 RepID=UPI0025449407|nr:alpha/beta hydrolase [Chondrinema litorale]UZR93441.1 alpha/beta hydrolase [Chondrinema litorale]